MKKYAIFISILVVFASLAIAMRVPAMVTKPNNPVQVIIPQHAIELAPGVFDIGTSVDVDGRVVQGRMLFHHRPGHNGGPGGSGGPNGGGSSCFAFISKGAKWKTVEPWVVNTANTHGLSQSFVFDSLTADIGKWETESSADILGDGTTTASTLVADEVSPDNVNEVYFGDIAGEGVIAVTIVWGIFNGPPFARELVEWDLVFDQEDFNWSSTGEAGKMDFQNIDTHEIGHATGMSHPEDTCTEETMFAFAEFGETIKRDLNGGDISGIQDLY